MEKTKEQLIAEIRYAIRLTQRTARLYRRVQTTGTFLTIVGGSAALASFYASNADLLRSWVLPVGALLFALAGAILISVRPADKAAANEADMKRYQSLMVKAQIMNVNELKVAIEEAHNGDAPEIEKLRVIAYNDVVEEINRRDQLIPLSKFAIMLRALA